MNKLNILQNFNKNNYFILTLILIFFINKCFPDKIYNQLSNDYKLIINYLSKNYDFKTLNSTRDKLTQKIF